MNARIIMAVIAVALSLACVYTGLGVAAGIFMFVAYILVSLA